MGVYIGSEGADSDVEITHSGVEATRIGVEIITNGIECSTNVLELHPIGKGLKVPNAFNMLRDNLKAVSE